MTWRQYYDKFYDWADSTQISRISSITDFSDAKTEEIIDAALSFVDEVRPHGSSSVPLTAACASPPRMF